MHYLKFDEYSNRLESLSTALKLRGVGANPRGGNFFFILFFLFNIFMYLSDPLLKKKVFDFNFMIIAGFYLLNNAKFNSKYGTRYFQSLKTAPQ
jgi:hypothetical protein